MSESARPEAQRFSFFDDDLAEANEEDLVGPATEATELVERVAAVHAAASAKTRRRVAVERIVAASIATEVELPPALIDEPDEVDEAPEPETADSLTIAQFYDRIKRALRAEFPDQVWVVGEIRGYREARGHRYLELADHGEDGEGRAQQLEVVAWSRDWPPIGAALREAGIDLEVGRVVRVRGRVSVWDGGSKLRFTMSELDVEALLGGIAAARRRLLQALSREGLLEKNKGLAVPLVPLRIGIVTSPGSEAHHDFVGQLARSGFGFDVLVERTLVQGVDAPAQVARALARLEHAGVDIAVVVRGGGARGDLAAFDSEEVARAIANAPFPVWCGIGHTGDRSVADEVAHSAFITPTACGEAVVARVKAYWDETLRRTETLTSLARSRLDTARARLDSAHGALARAARHEVERRTADVAGWRAGVARAATARLSIEITSQVARRERLRDASGHALSGAQADVERHVQVLRAYDPSRQFERGWSLTRREGGGIVRSTGMLAAGERLVTRFLDGQATSVVAEVTPGTRRRLPASEEDET